MEDTEFTEFQRYFKEYQQRFGLTGYSVFFKYEPLGECFASIAVNQHDMVATVTLNSELPEGNKPFRDIKRDVRHEALHLLLFRLEHLASCRYIAEDELYEAVEELVNKMEVLIGD